MFFFGSSLPPGFTPKLKERFAAIAGKNSNNEVEKMFLYVACSAVLSQFVYSAERSDDFCHSRLVELNSRYCWFKPLSFAISDRQILPNGPLFAVVEFESFRVVAIRGSMSLEDWLFVNFDVATASVGNYTNLHAGFARNAKSIPFRFCAEYNRSLQYDFGGNGMDIKPTPVIFTGHSMGGAVAEICALQCLNCDHVYAITFAAPFIVKESPRQLLESKSRMIRFHFKDDLVPNVLRSEGYIAFEKLILLDEANRDAKIVNELAADFTPDFNNWPSAVDFFRENCLTIIEKHRMERYLHAIVPTSSEFTLSGHGLGEINQVSCNFLFVPGGDSLLVKYEQHQGMPYHISVKGNGVNGCICRAELRHKDNVCRLVDLQYDMQHDGSGVCVFTALFDVKDVVIAETNVLSQPTSRDFRLTLWNGFQTTECLFGEISCSNSVAVMGLTGSGKSCLIRGIRRQLAGESPQQFESDDTRFIRDSNDVAESFVINGIRVYETPGLPQPDVQVINDVQNVFDKLPPSLIVIVARKGVYDCQPKDGHVVGLATMIQRILERNPDARFLVVITKSPPDNWDETTIEKWKVQFGLTAQQIIDVVKVNSGIEQDNQQQGLDIVWEKIRTTLLLSPPPITNLRTWWEYLSGLRTTLFLSTLGYIFVSVVWVAVTKTPPPPPI